MRPFKTIVYRVLLLLCSFSAALATAQQTKTYKESFDVDPGVEVSLSTSYADIEFETWNRNSVQVEAVVSLEGASEEEAEAYFEEHGIEIMGNSSRVEVRTRDGRQWAYQLRAGAMDMDIEIPDVTIPDIGPILEAIEIPELEAIAGVEALADMPPMPPMPPMPNFDYKAFEEDGEAYMAKWQEEFGKRFDADYQKRLQAWAERAEERAKAMEERMEQRTEGMKERLQQREAERKARLQEGVARMEETREAREEMRKQMNEAREALRAARERAREDREKARVFFMQGDERNRKYKIEKTIRIKMPKGAKLNLDVRHGEVILAENARDLKANLSYASLLASTIDGDLTRVRAQYSPVSVKFWRSGALSTNFSEQVRLDQVQQLKLQATSSDVTIDRLMRHARIDNDLGALRIYSIDRDFGDVKITVRNGDLECALPDADFDIALAQRNSQVDLPDHLTWDTGPGSGVSQWSGFSGSRGSGRLIDIDAAYSQVALHD